MDVAPDNDELSRFREQWKAEVRSRATAGHSSSAIPSSSSSGEPAAEAESPTQAERPVAPPEAALQPVELYRRAVRAEESGKLDDALRLYRQAFRKEPNVDRVYHREEVARAASQPPSSPIHEHPKVLPAEPALASSLDKLSLGRPSIGYMELDHLLAQFPNELAFLPEDETLHSPLETMPLEILLHVLLILAYNHDVKAIERFASVCRKARSVSLDPVIWRYIVQKTYIPPQIPRIGILDDLTVKYGSNYRKLYKEHPRLRLDGVYIAVCHYVRAGLSENLWISVSHLVTYHRYLRFLPTGEVLSLLANEDTNPQEVVHLLQPGLRMKGFLQGNWSLEGTTVLLTDLLDPYSPSSKYTFKMVLRLKSRPTGRWNKLDLDDYLSVEQETGEEIAFPLTHERPFWFSKVKSY